MCLRVLLGRFLGMSWFKSSWVYPGEGEISRLGALKRKFGECKYLYAVVILFLFVGAVVETLTIALLMGA